MQLHKIRQYSFISLLKILVYRMVYKAMTYMDEFALYLFKKDYVIKQHSDKETWKAAIQRFREYFTYLRDDKEGVIAEANQIISGHLIVFGHNYDFNTSKDWLKDPVTGKLWPDNVFWDKASFKNKGCADVKYVLEVNKLNSLVMTALAYYYTKDKKYIEYINNAIDGWVKVVQREKTVANKIVMDLAFRVINLIQITMLCGDSDYYWHKTYPKVESVIIHHNNQLWRYLSSRWFKSGNDNNHNIGEIVGLYVSSLWLSSTNIKVNKRPLEKSLNYLEDLLEKLISESGVYIEQSANYTKVVYDFLLIFDIFRKTTNDSTSAQWFAERGYLTRLKKYLSSISYHGKLPNFGDNDHAQVLIPFYPNDNPLISFEYTTKFEHKSEDYLDGSQWLYRSSDDNDIFVFTRVGKFAYFVEGAYTHAHCDLLSLLLSVKGQEVFIDKGCLFYNSGIEIRKEYTSSNAHNTVHVNGCGMADYLPVGYKGYPLSNIIDSKTSSNECHFLGSANYKNVKHSRQIDYRRNEIVVKDKIITGSNSDVSISYLLHPAIKVEEISDGNYNLLAGDLKLVLHIFGVEKCMIHEEEYAPHYAERQKTKAIIGYANNVKDKQIETNIMISK